MAETIYRQLGMSKLSKELQILRKQKETEYKDDCDALSIPFYAKKRSKEGVAPEEEETYKTAKRELWNNWKTWAISAGVYEAVTPEKLLTEYEAQMSEVLTRVNETRAQLQKAPLELKDKAAE